MRSLITMITQRSYTNSKTLKSPTVVSAFLVASLLSACSEDGVESSGTAANVTAPVNSATPREVSVRWTPYGIPHVKANDWEGLGYGFAHAVASNTVCVLARELIVVRGEQAKYFGSTERNINSDAFHQALLNEEKLDDYLASSTGDSRAMDNGYVNGYNNFISSRADDLPASCKDAPWVKAIDEYDLARLAIGVGIRYGLGRVTNQIATAEPGLELAQLEALDLHVDPEMIGSNALGFGSALTDTGRGILMGNPHYPWQGASRFHMAHLTIPGEVDVMGAGLISSPRIAIGFTDSVAWSHTVSTALRFTMFRFDLVPGNPMAYRVGDDIHPIEAIQVSVESDDGPIDRTVYMTHVGPVVVGQPTPWNDRYVYAMRDVNYENYRAGIQYRKMAQAGNVEELRQSLGDYQAAAFVNTIAADKDGGALYADMSAIPNVSTELLARCAVDTENGQRSITLDGSNPACNWQVDAAAAHPGLMPPSEQPSLITDTYVSNSNDSYWLSNVDNPLEGFSPIIGNERSTRSLRTRAGLKMVEETINSGEKFSRQSVQDLLFNHRHYGAEVFLDEILSVCSEQENLAEACAILSAWDRRQDVDSVGAHIFNQFWNSARELRNHYSEPFSLDDPIHTPRGLTLEKQETKDYIAASLAAAIASLDEAGIALDATWGDVQFAMRNGEKIGIPGGAGGQGMFSVITARFNAENGGYTPITHGNSYIQTVTWNEDGTPDAQAILTYSQSPEADSPFYADMTKLYSESQWVDLPFTEAEISEQMVKEEILSL